MTAEMKRNTGLHCQACGAAAGQPCTVDCPEAGLAIAAGKAIAILASLDLARMPLAVSAVLGVLRTALEAAQQSDTKATAGNVAAAEGLTDEKIDAIADQFGMEDISYNLNPASHYRQFARAILFAAHAPAVEPAPRASDPVAVLTQPPAPATWEVRFAQMGAPSKEKAMEGEIADLRAAYARMNSPVRAAPEGLDAERLDWLERCGSVSYSFETAEITFPVPNEMEGANSIRELIDVASGAEDGAR
jgi:hypothetical protein